MRQRIVLLTVGLAAGFGLLAGSFTLERPPAVAAPPCFVPLFTASSGNALAICPNVPPCAGTITVTVTGLTGTVGFASCGGVSVSCTVPVFPLFCTNSVPPPPPPAPPGASFACGVVKPPGAIPPAFAFCTG